MKTESSVTALRLHVYRGEVWQARGYQLGKATGMVPVAFCNNLKQPVEVRVVGETHNLELLLLLAELRDAGVVQRLEVVSPLVCSLASERKSPQQVLALSRVAEFTPSLGGAHEVTSREIKLWRWAVASNEEQVQHEFAASELGRRLLFVPRLRLDLVLAMIRAAVDPRWFVDPACPDRMSKMEMFFGLNPKTQAGVLGLADRWRHSANCSLVQRAWSALTSVEAVAPARDFLWAEFQRQRAKREGQPSAFVYAYLRSSQRFLRYLKQQWLDYLYVDSPSRPVGGLFCPRQFFRDEAEVAAYVEYETMNYS